LKGEIQMKKKMLVLVVVILLLASTIQVALAHHEPKPEPPPSPTGGSCNMGASWWDPGTGPGNAKGVKPGERGMWHVHHKDIPDQAREDGYTYGAKHMDVVTTAQCGG
jgi:hypothetical protein